MSSYVGTASTISVTASRPTTPVTVPVFTHTGTNTSLVPSPAVTASPGLFLVISDGFGLSSNVGLRWAWSVPVSSTALFTTVLLSPIDVAIYAPYSFGSTVAS